MIGFKKMKRVFLYIGVVVLFCASIGTGVWGKNVKKVQALEFRGLESLSKKEVLNGVAIEGRKDGILIDLDSLERALGDNSQVERYTISEKGNRVILSIVEKKPALFMALITGKDRKYETILVELNSRFEIISENIIRTGTLPLILIEEGDLVTNDDSGKSSFVGRKVSQRVKDCIGLLRQLKKKDLILYKEIAEVYLQKNRQVKVVLRGRKTEFYLKLNEKSRKDIIRNSLNRQLTTGMVRLKYITGYLDRLKFYPPSVIIYDDMAVIK
ncbi:MAG: hypothetical protein GY754_00115 [bacterium]|nr:hypothetical protein [bacterium]